MISPSGAFENPFRGKRAIVAIARTLLLRRRRMLLDEQAYALPRAA
jgi:ABC-type polar amino acid transport system ATPase subunit